MVSTVRNSSLRHVQGLRVGTHLLSFSVSLFHLSLPDKLAVPLVLVNDAAQLAPLSLELGFFLVRLHPTSDVKHAVSQDVLYETAQIGFQDTKEAPVTHRRTIHRSLS